mmetsp:Transcript_60930/g.144426  ORF Transcript_60930/g.144426 Transcript_60930/m.144426 type:complete len:232 (+) Transcript_60930:211-906(+)
MTRWARSTSRSLSVSAIATVGKSSANWATSAEAFASFLPSASAALSSAFSRGSTRFQAVARAAAVATALPGLMAEATSAARRARSSSSSPLRRSESAAADAQSAITLLPSVATSSREVGALRVPKFLVHEEPIFLRLASCSGRGDAQHASISAFRALAPFSGIIDWRSLTGRNVPLLVVMVLATSYSPGPGVELVTIEKRALLLRPNMVCAGFAGMGFACALSGALLRLSC